jgi:hypothetical protein
VLSGQLPGVREPVVEDVPFNRPDNLGHPCEATKGRCVEDPVAGGGSHSASLDRRIGINWTKHRVEPDQALRDMLKQGLGPHIAPVRKVANRRRSEVTTVDHKAYEALIARKAKLLTLPKAPKIEHSEEGREKGTVTPNATDIQREGRGDWPQRVGDRCEFKEAHMTAAGPLWDTDMRGQKVIVTFNVTTRYGRALFLRK